MVYWLCTLTKAKRQGLHASSLSLAEVMMIVQLHHMLWHVPFAAETEYYGELYTLSHAHLFWSQFVQRCNICIKMLCSVVFTQQSPRCRAHDGKNGIVTVTSKSPFWANLNALLPLSLLFPVKTESMYWVYEQWVIADLDIMGCSFRVNHIRTGVCGNNRASMMEGGISVVLTHISYYKCLMKKSLK